jgi:CheY-like chemotaxis protein
MCKLVMIDDNPVQHLIMQRMFERCDLFPDVAHALDGRTIIEFLQEYRTNTEELPNVILLDLHMPEFSGWDFLAEFERLYWSFKKIISVYIISSSVAPEDRARARQYPFVKDFLTKPISAERLHSLHAMYAKANRHTG